jgi:tetratricopeptide (TPR) repeat protein
MAEGATLPELLARQIADLVREGDAFGMEHNMSRALEAMERAWSLLPDPKTRWRAAGHIQMSIGDAHYKLGAFPQARAALELALACPGGEALPFANLRLGQTLLKTGDEAGAADQLETALKRANGEWIFTEEPQALRAFLRQTKGI